VPYPRAVRDYDAFELSVSRRLSNGWALRASYLWSRLWGNYSGLANGDANGALRPNTSRLFDNPVMAFDERGEAVFGPLPADRPHQLKTQLIFDFSFGTTVGLNAYVASGTPVTRMAHILGPLTYPVTYLGRGSDGRTPTRSQLDVLVRQEIRLGGEKRLQLEVNVLNLFNQRTATTRYPFVNQPGPGIFTTSEDFFNGIDTEALMREQGLPQEPLFLMDSEFQLPRETRLGVRFAF
jgi:outer membrane receptor protein involved in Fe transport